MVLFRNRDWAGGAGPVVDVATADVPGAPDKGAAVASEGAVPVVAEGCAAEVVALPNENPPLAGADVAAG
jgi:hypothetical protein